MKKMAAKCTRLTVMKNELGHVFEQKSEDVESMTLRALRPGSNPAGALA